MKCVVFLGVAAVSLSGDLAHGVTRRVPEDFSSIQAAVDLSASGDTVLVGSGTWDENQTRTILIDGSALTITAPLFLKPGVVVIGTEGAESTTLDGSPDAYGAVFHYLAGADTAVVRGFTLSSVNQSIGDGVLAAYASPLRVEACKIVDTRYALALFEQSVLVSGSHVARNGGEFFGVIEAVDSHLSLEDTTFDTQRTAATSIRLFAHSPVPRSLRLSRCTFQDLEGIACQVQEASVVVEECTFLRCGGGGFHATGCTGVIRFNTFAYDTSDGGGGAVLNNCDIEVSNNTFYRCRGTLVAAALSIAFTDGGVHNNIFTGCTGPRGTVSFGGGTQHPSTGCNLFWDNEGNDFWDDWVPAPTDIEADPEFCNETILDLTLHSTSPAAPTNSACGLLGAFDVGCGSVSVDATSWGRLKNLYRSSDHEER